MVRFTKSQLSCLQQIQSTLARMSLKAAKYHLYLVLLLLTQTNWSYRILSACAYKILITT